MTERAADNGAKIEVWNRKNKYGWTPLLIAAFLAAGCAAVSPAPRPWQVTEAQAALNPYGAWANVSLRRGSHSVLIAENLGWPSASALANALDPLLGRAGHMEKQEGGDLD